MNFTAIFMEIRGTLYHFIWMSDISNTSGEYVVVVWRLGMNVSLILGF